VVPPRAAGAETFSLIFGTIAEQYLPTPSLTALLLLNALQRPSRASLRATRLQAA
jgi:hypothetical protein